MNKKGLKIKDILKEKNFRLPIFIFLAGVILMLSADAFFPGEYEAPDKETKTETEVSNLSDKEDLEKKIKELIESIGGVKSASVVITYENSGEYYTQKDKESTEKNTSEDDGSGGNREISENSSSEETVYTESSDGSKQPFIVSEKYADIRGVAVVIKGSYNSGAEEKIIRALEVLLNIPTHKIQVIW